MLFKSGINSNNYSLDVVGGTVYAIGLAENLEEKKVEIITSGLSNELSTKKIIKISLFMPQIGNGLRAIDDLITNQYAWASLPDEKSRADENYNIVYESNRLNPWKLIIKK